MYQLDIDTLIVLHDALTSYVHDEKSKKYCVNPDKGHPFYKTTNGKANSEGSEGDSPDRHPLYIVGSAVLEAMRSKTEGLPSAIIENSPFKNWDAFVLAIEQSHKQTGSI